MVMRAGTLACAQARLPKLTQNRRTHGLPRELHERLTLAYPKLFVLNQIVQEYLQAFEREYSQIICSFKILFIFKDFELKTFQISNLNTDILDWRL